MDFAYHWWLNLTLNFIQAAVWKKMVMDLGGTSICVRTSGDMWHRKSASRFKWRWNQFLIPAWEATQWIMTHWRFAIQNDARRLSSKAVRRGGSWWETNTGAVGVREYCRCVQVMFSIFLELWVGRSQYCQQIYFISDCRQYVKSVSLFSYFLIITFLRWICLVIRELLNTI